MTPGLYAARDQTQGFMRAGYDTDMAIPLGLTDTFAN